MPIATPQGTLDFKSVDKVTFVGASSNTVIDTTTGSLGVGVGVGGPTSNLHVVGNTRLEGDINMLHTSNTASIKLNSNVVTEFPRSKKLIKYPRVALTSAAETGSGYEGYIVTRSSQFSSYNAWEAFDENNPKGTGQEGAGAGWASTIPGTYSVSTGAETGSVEHHTGSVQGEWIQIQLPESIYLHDFVIESRSETTYNTSGFDHGFPEGCVLYGSNNGSSWANIKSFTTGDKANSRAHTENINEMTRTYKYFALVVNSTHVFQNTTQVSHVSIGQIRLFGTPEYDPEAHGTDVTVKSYPNVPNTDWLEVYYDAKNYTSGPVQDLSTNSFNGTLTNGASFNNSDGIDKFVFDGSNDYISGSIPSTFTGNQTYTFSIWVKPDSHPSGFIAVFGIGTDSTNDSIGLFFDSGNIIHLTYANNLATTTYATIGEWVHITGTYDGTGRTIFVNGKLIGTDSYSSLTLAGTTFRLGSNLSGGQNFNGSIANFRLFNRALTSDEIYQLYAYQKEDFGHSTNNMTLKAGRLGIGTSEPRAALDVRGDFYAPGTIVQVEQSIKRDDSSTSGTSASDIPGLSVTIHPKFGTSKILVSYQINMGGNYHMFLRVKRTQNGTTTYIGLGDANGNRPRATSYQSHFGVQTVEFLGTEILDPANGMDPITYQVQFWVAHTGYAAWINRSYDNYNNQYGPGCLSSSITVKEVCQ
jgi:hypothetical protein